MEKRINVDAMTIDQLKVLKSDLHDQAERQHAEYQQTVQQLTVLRQLIDKRQKEAANAKPVESNKPDAPAELPPGPAASVE